MCTEAHAAGSVTGYEVHPARSEDVNEARVWIKDSRLHEELHGRRRVVRITNSKKIVYCEALYADEYYITNYGGRSCPLDPQHDRLIFMSAWYRRLLGIEGQGCVPITISLTAFPRSAWWQIRVCIGHPQLVVLVATVLGLIGLGLGLIGVGLGLLPLRNEAEILSPPLKAVVGYFSWSLVVVGLGEVLWSVVLLFRRT